MSEIVKGVIIGLITAVIIATLSSVSGGWLIKLLGGVTEGDIADLREKLEITAVEAARAHARVSGLRIDAVHATTDQFACGSGGKADEDSLVVMYGSYDGTSCGVQNRNLYKQLSLVVPE